MGQRQAIVVDIATASEQDGAGAVLRVLSVMVVMPASLVNLEKKD